MCVWGVAYERQVSPVTDLAHTTSRLEPMDGTDAEDTHVYERYFFGRAGGTFLEAGAVDGVRFSVTHALDKDLGWRGVGAAAGDRTLVPCLEAVPSSNTAISFRKLHVAQGVSKYQDKVGEGKEGGVAFSASLHSLRRSSGGRVARGCSRAVWVTVQERGFLVGTPDWNSPLIQRIRVGKKSCSRMFFRFAG